MTESPDAQPRPTPTPGVPGDEPGDVPGDAADAEYAEYAQDAALPHQAAAGGAAQEPDRPAPESTGLASLTGSRQHLTVLLPDALTGTPGAVPAGTADGAGRPEGAATAWAEGPMPFTNGSRVADTATRSGYFTPSAARALYGTPRQPCRWHSPHRVAHGPLHLDGMELLRTATERRPQQGLAVLHFTVRGPHLLNTLRAVARRGRAPADPLTGPLEPDRLLAGAAEVRMDDAPFALARPYTVAFFTPTADPAHAPALRPTPDTPVPASADRWLRQLTVRANERELPLAPETAATLPADAVRISADWSALVLRSGTAFLGHTPDQDEGDHFGFAALQARTVHLDAILLGTMQRDHIEEIADELSEVFDSPRLTERVGALERRIARFRSTHWRHNLTIHGPANDILLAFHEQNRLPARFAEILAAAGDYARLAQTQESQQISGALGLLTILGLPLGTALGILQVLGDESPTHLVIALAAAVAATVAALTTPYGRLVLHSLRGPRNHR